MTDAFALRAKEDRSRCPYCHDLLGGAAVERVTCEACGTAHHAACLEELGRCATLGCAGRVEDDEALHERVRRHAEARSRAAPFDLDRVELVRPEPDRPATLAALARSGRGELVQAVLLLACGFVVLFVLVTAFLLLRSAP